MILHPSMILLLPAILLALWAQAKVRSTYATYARVPVRSRMTGAGVAEMILRDADIAVVDHPGQYPAAACGVAAIGGRMTDHYDPRNRMLNLSEDVYSGRNIAALGIAAHEAGHAVQHAQAYAPLALRNVIYPVCNLGSGLAFPLFFLGFLFRSGMLMQVGVILFTFAVFFTVLTLPVEFNASRRALRALERGGYLDSDELAGARRVLSAAAMTYVASAVMAIVHLLRMVLMSRD